MILLIDNYDSFSYNLYQLAASVEADIKVIRNDGYTVEEIEKMGPAALILSPGPGRPSEAGICEEAIKRFAGRIPSWECVWDTRPYAKFLEERSLMPGS